MAKCALCDRSVPRLEIHGGFAYCPTCAGELATAPSELSAYVRADYGQRFAALAEKMDAHPVGRALLDFVEGRAARLRRKGAP